jgi:hypothetical protein
VRIHRDGRYTYLNVGSDDGNTLMYDSAWALAPDFWG